MFRKLSSSSGISIRKLASTWAEQKAFYRFLNHSKVTEEILIKEASTLLQSLAKGSHLLCLQDTSEVNLTAHDNRIKNKDKLGRLDYAKYALGFKLHPCFVIDAQALKPLGFSDIKLWHRPFDMPQRFERDFRKKSIEEKESYKWIEVAHKSKNILQEAQTVTFIQDREGDIYELFCLIPDEKTHLIVRSNIDRSTTEGGSLTEQLLQQPFAGKHTIEVEADKRIQRTKRTAELEIRFCKITITKPTSSHMNGIQSKKELYVVEAKEINPPTNEPRIYWRLLTTHVAEDFETALLIIEWYRCR